MRDSFIKELTKQAELDKKVVLITADLGFGIFDNFKKKFPNQFINVGVAEQNMTGIACGLALEGFRVFTYSIGNFCTLRCLEQIRNDICYHNLDVTIVCSGGGFSYGQLGVSHFATEDLSILRALPNMTIYTPSESWESELITKSLKKEKGPKYLRLDKSIGGSKRTKNDLIISGVRKVYDGEDVAIISIGGILEEAIKTREILINHDISTTILSVTKFKPLMSNEIISAIKKTKILVTLEENNIFGGLSSAVCELCIQHNTLPKKFISLGIPDTYPSIVGTQKFLRKHFKMDATSISSNIIANL